jgi:undecaprenyl-phosphate glucose phosphotransferase
MVRPGIENVAAESNTGAGIACSSSLRPKNRWRFLNATASLLRSCVASPTVADGPKGRVVLVGAPRDARRLVRRLGDTGWSGLPIVGFVDAGHGRSSSMRPRSRHLPLHSQTDPVPVLGSVDHLGELVDRVRATHVVMAVSQRPSLNARAPMTQLINSDVVVHWVLVDSGRLDLGTVWVPSQLWQSERRPRRWLRLPAWESPSWARSAKRLIDFSVAAVALLVLAPLFAMVAMLILVTSGLPIFYTQKRVGQGGRAFHIIKFRSMRSDAESETGPIWASNHDTRCTRIGDWLRHTNIDELPQLINVLRGDMSLVGPRPERPTFVEQFQRTIADYDLRHAVPGGMTGWAQVHGWRGRTSLRKRVQYDLDYIQRWSIGLDLRILLMTVQHVFWGKTTWNEPKRPTNAQV